MVGSLDAYEILHTASMANRLKPTFYLLMVLSLGVQTHAQRASMCHVQIPVNVSMNSIHFLATAKDLATGVAIVQRVSIDLFHLMRVLPGLV